MNIGHSKWLGGLAVAALLAPATAALAAGAWQAVPVDPAQSVIGVDGRTHKASCSGFPGTDARFSYWARRTSSKNLMIYFEGGGACWDPFTCSRPFGVPEANGVNVYSPMVPPGTDPSQYAGIFRSDPANPVADWNVLYIPYCTGDIHTGSATQTYPNTNPALAPLGIPLGAPIQIQHRGFDNFMVALEWARREVPKAKNVLVTGVSAGGYGATANSPWVGKAFPQAHLYVLADASQGVTTAAFDSGPSGRRRWNPQLADWVFGPDPNAVAGGDLMRLAALGQPHAKLAQFTTAADGVQTFFYGLQLQLAGQPSACGVGGQAVGTDWHNKMSRQVTADAASVPNYRYHVAPGNYHTLLADELFYSDASAGRTVADSLSAMLANRGGTGGQGGKWDSVACPLCLAQAACP